MNTAIKQELFTPGDCVWFETANGQDYNASVIDDDGGLYVLVLVGNAVLHDVPRYSLMHSDDC